MFADRLEVWNPGSLPGSLTPESLRTDHPSMPVNPLLAESLYLARYIEKAGSGTQAMIAMCLEAGLPEVGFEQRQGSFVVTLWRDWLTEEVLAAYGLNDRQKKAVRFAKAASGISNAQYREIGGVSESTALRDLKELTTLGMLERVGGTGRTTSYVVARAKPS